MTPASPAPAVAPPQGSPRTPEGCVCTLIYDGDCRFCRRSIELLRRWDRRRRVRPVPFQAEAELVGLPAISRAALERAMHLVAPDGRVFAGAAAAPEILKLLPGGRPLAWVFGIPGVPFLAARVYRLIARNRHRLGCGSVTCTLGG